MKALSLLLFALALSLAGYPQYWISLNSGTSNHLGSVCFPDTITGYIVGSSGTILKTTDGGLNWVPQYYNNSYHFSDVQFINPDTGYIAGYLPAMRSTGILLKTTNGGIDWIKQDIDTTHQFSGIQLLGSDTIFVSGNQVLKSFDGGTSWSVVNTPEPGPFWACNAESYFLLGANVEIYNTKDGGDNWVSQFYAVIPGLCYDIRFSNLNNGLAVGGGYSQGLYYEILYFTRNGGSQWNRSTYENEIYYHAAYFTDDTTAYVVGTEGSIIKTTDAGEHYTDQVSGTTLTLNDVYFVNPGTGYIVGNNGTLLKSSSVPVGIDIPLVPDEMISVYPNPFKDELSIDIDSRFAMKNTSLAIYNSLGLLTFEEEIRDPHTDLNLNHLVPGIYFLKVTNSDKQHVVKLIKNP